MTDDYEKVSRRSFLSMLALAGAAAVTVALVPAPIEEPAAAPQPDVFFNINASPDLWATRTRPAAEGVFTYEKLVAGWQWRTDREPV